MHSPAGKGSSSVAGSAGHTSSASSVNSSPFAAATAAVNGNRSHSAEQRSAKKLRKLAEDSFSFASEQKKHVIKGKNHHQQLITKYRQDVEQDLKNTKQQIIRHVLYSRALERAKHQIDIVQDALHSHLIDKSDPLLWSTIQLRKKALQQNFHQPFDENVIQRFNSHIGWVYPGLIPILLEALDKYNDDEFTKALEAIPIAPTQINRDLYIKIANRTTKGLISDLEAVALFAMVEKKIPISDMEQSHGKDDGTDDIYQRRWKMLKNILRKKIFRLYLARKAHEYISEMEAKLKHKSGFYFPSAGATTANTTNINNSVLSSSMSLSSSVLSEPATLQLDAAGSPNSKALFTKSLTSLPSLDINNSSAASSSNNHNHTISSKNKSKPHGNKNQISTYGVPPKKEKLSLREKLQQELNASMAKQSEIQSKITADLARLYQEGMNLAPPSASATSITTASLTADNTAPSTAVGGGRPSTTMSIGNGSINSGGHGSNAASVGGNSSNKLQSPAVAQYFKQTAVQKLVAAMEKYVRNIFILRFKHWYKVSIAKELERKCCQFSQNVACAKFQRFFLWNYLRRLSQAWEQMKSYVKIFEEREKYAAAVDIQRHYRGYVARCTALRILQHSAAIKIQALMRVFLAYNRIKKLRHMLKMRKSVRKIETMWKNNIWKRALKKAFDYHRKQRAIQLIQRIYRGHRGRVKFQKKLLKKKQGIAVVKFQSLWRRYRAVIRVEKVRRQTRRRKAAITIQSMVRGKLARLKFSIRWKRHLKAKKIQYAWLIYKAKKETNRRRRRRASMKIQSVARGMLGRHRVKRIRSSRKAAIQKIKPVGQGYIARRRTKVPMQKHLQRRQQAARKIQILLAAFYLGKKARRRVAIIREKMKDTRLRIISATKIQSVIRSKLARIRVNKIRQEIALREQEKALQDAKLRSLPYYYRLQTSYWQQQNMYHRKYAIKIQCMIRRFLAKRRTYNMKVAKSVQKIQTFYKSAKLIEEAKEIRRSLALEASRRQSMQMASVTNIQRIVRGFNARRRVKKLRAAETIKWAIMEFHVIAKTRKAIATFRIRKVEAERRKAAALKIQALMRGVLQRRRYKKSYRSLLRQRALRIRAKKEKAALVVQCAYRCYRAKKRVAQQRILYGEKVKERQEMAELERSIAGMHEDWMQQLLVIRAQTGIRGLLARTEFAKKVQEYKELQIQLEKQKRHDAAAKIQALARGVSSRKRFKKNLPALKKALKMKSYCVECEAKVATRRCRQCKDRYCADCYDLLHQKGNRKMHSWENIKLDARIMAMIYEQNRAATAGGGLAAGGDDKKKGNAKDWEEHYDNAAKAKYWFNKKTGEASWISPFA